MFSLGFHGIWSWFQLRFGFRENLDQNSDQISSFLRIFTWKFSHKNLHTESRCIERIDTRKIIKIGSLRAKVWWVGETRIFWENKINLIWSFPEFWEIHVIFHPQKINVLKFRLWTYTHTKNYQNPSRELRERESNAPFFWTKKPFRELNELAL